MVHYKALSHRFFSFDPCNLWKVLPRVLSEERGIRDSWNVFDIPIWLSHKELGLLTGHCLLPGEMPEAESRDLCGGGKACKDVCSDTFSGSDHKESIPSQDSETFSLTSPLKLKRKIERTNLRNAANE